MKCDNFVDVVRLRVKFEHCNDIWYMDRIIIFIYDNSCSGFLYPLTFCQIISGRHINI